MEKFDRGKLSPPDLIELSQAVSRAAPKIRFWYNLPNTFFIQGSYNPDSGEYLDFCFINKERIVQQTGATSDFDKLHKDCEFITQDKYSSKTIAIGDATRPGFHFKKMFGIRDLDICVHNPTQVLPNIIVGRKFAELVQIDGLGWGNTYDSRVNLETGVAFLNEDDQDLAHRLGLEYSPTGIMEMDSLRPSDSSLHNKKPGFDEKGKPVIYCDNPCCTGQLKSPLVVVEPKTGGAYHSSTCFWKDVGIKKYLTTERKDVDLLGVKPVKVPLAEALTMYLSGRLQQSRSNKQIQHIEFREIEFWPEGAVLFHR